MLNTVVIIIIFQKNAVAGMFKYLVIPVSLNNLIMVMSVLGDFLLYEHLNNYHGSVLQTLINSIMESSIRGAYFYKVPLTFNKFYAMSWPLAYDARFTKTFSVQFACFCFLIPYVKILFGKFLWYIKVARVVHDVYVVITYFVVEFVNQCMLVAILFKLKGHMSSQSWGSKSLQDARFKEIRQTIFAVLVQTWVPLLLQFPLFFLALLSEIASGSEGDQALGALNSVLQLSLMVYILSTVLDPIVLLTIVGSFRNYFRTTFFGSTSRRLIFVFVWIACWIVFSVLIYLIF